MTTMMCGWRQFASDLNSERKGVWLPVRPFGEKMTPEILAIEREVDQLKADGNLPEAIEKMKEALAIDDSFARGHLTLSVLYGKVDEHLKSVEHAERVIQLEPNDKFNYVALSETYRRAFEGTRDETFIQKAEDAKARAAQGG
jgi:tetratricopeptide (TPR) repeat protein